MKKFIAPEWMKDWQAKYAPLLVSGLTDGPTYVRLNTKSLPTLDVVLAFRPMVDRIEENILVIGGKLSVFPVEDSIKVQPSSEATMVQWLKSAYPSLDLPKCSAKRAGTVLMAMVRAPYESGDAFRAAFKESSRVGELVTYIEEQTGAPVENRERVLRALNEAFLGAMGEHFQKAPPVTSEDSEKVIDLMEKKAVMAMIEALSASDETKH